MGKKNRAAPQQPPKPWERQEGEGPQAFRAFAAYRDSGTGGAKRSLTKTAQSLTKSDGSPYSDGTLKQWSRKWNWQERVAAWDDEMDRQTREELAKGITGMMKNHVGIAQAMLTKALKALQRIPEDELTAQDITRMVDIASKLERLSRGEATERTEGKRTIAGTVQANLKMPEIDFSGLTDSELEQLDEFIDKLAAE